MFDKPNVSIPLASSYNERGVLGLTTTITNGIDQRKVNSIYDLVKNSITGGGTLYVVKRPGITIDADSFGTTGQVSYLCAIKPGSSNTAGASTWVFSTNGNDIRASDNAGTTTVIATAAGYVPAYWDRTAISGTETLVVQLRNAANAQTVWYSSAIATFTQITDADFTGLTLSGKMEFLDGYAFVLDSMNRIYNSDVNSLSSWGAANYITKQVQQDNPRGLVRLGNHILAFGQGTMERYYNAGNASGSPLQVDKAGFHRIGLAANDGTSGGHYYATIGSVVYFYGRKGGTSPHARSVFAYDGSQINKVSTQSIDKILLDATGSFSIHAVSINGQNAIAISLDLVTASTQRWLMFFPSWNEWFEWNSTVFMPINNGQMFLGVGSNQHRIYQFVSAGGTEQWSDNGTDFTWSHQFQIPGNGNQRKFMPYMALKGDTARSAQNISVSFSDDDYQNFSTARTIDMTSKQKMLTRCGSWQGSRAIRLSHAGNTEVRLEKFLARIE